MDPQLDADTDDLDDPLARRRDGDTAFPPTAMALGPGFQADMSPAKPRTSVGLSRDQAKTPIKLLEANNSGR